MLAGSAVVAIWNNITPEGQASFYDWHLNEHIPERVDIPGFLRGRRYEAVTPETDPRYFTLYETRDFAVLRSDDYAARLNAPTPWTLSATSHFRNTARALAHVVGSGGIGMGGALLTVRFAADDAAKPALVALVAGLLGQPRLCGAHLCIADDASSQERTEESRERTDIEAPPTWFAMVEATDPAAFDGILTAAALAQAGARAPIHRGLYRLEFTRE